MSAVEPVPVTEPDVVHVAHFLDGYPLCWTYDLDGTFNATTDDSAVTCPACLTIIAEP